MDEETTKKYAKVSEVAWDEAAEVHKEYRYQQLLDGFKRPGFVGMPRQRYDTLVNHGVQGKAAFQACCNNGRDILSIKNMGASRCMGFDISSEFIQHGKDFAAAGGIECELIQSDVYQLDHGYDGQFDIGLITLGTFMWMPDLGDFFAVMKRLLKKDGWLFIHEFHPIDEIIKVDPEKGTMDLARGYFDNTPWLWTKGLDYFGGKSYEATPTYRFLHKISDVIEALVNGGFAIETFKELEEDRSSGVYKEGKSQTYPLPRSYILTANRVAPGGANVNAPYEFTGKIDKVTF